MKIRLHHRIVAWLIYWSDRRHVHRDRSVRRLYGDFLWTLTFLDGTKDSCRAETRRQAVGIYRDCIDQRAAAERDRIARIRGLAPDQIETWLSDKPFRTGSFLI